MRKVLLCIPVFVVVAGLIAFARAGASRTSRSPIRKVVLVSIDTLRADRLSCYGYSRPTSPEIDAFAAQSALFERATSPAPWTAPSMAAMIAGRYPAETGVYTNQSPIQTGLNTLPELFSAAGVPTAWFNTNPVMMLRHQRFHTGFAHVAPKEVPKKKLPFSEIEPAVHEWLEKHAAGDFFLWVHSMDPHSPPTTGNPYHKDKKWHVYDGEVKLVDDAMGRLFAKLDSLGIAGETLVVFTSDHGEAFSEHMLPGHQNVIYDEVLHIPLIIRYPGMTAPRRIREPVELVDLYRTIANLADLPVPDGVRGESLVPLIEGKSDERSRRYSFHSRYYVHPLGLHYLAVRDREYKLIARVPYDYDPAKPRKRERDFPQWAMDQPGTTFELYRYDQDVREKSNLIFFGAEPGVAERLQKELLGWRDRLAADEPVDGAGAAELDEAARETLRKLGYAGD